MVRRLISSSYLKSGQHSFGMALLNKEVLFGPIRNWSNRESKILLKYNRKVGVNKRRQYVLKDMASCYKVNVFEEDGVDALKGAYYKTQRLRKERVSEES